MFVRGCEIFLSGPAQLFCLALPGCSLTKYANLFSLLCSLISKNTVMLLRGNETADLKPYLKKGCYLDNRFCKQFSDNCPFLPGQQDSCSRKQCTKPLHQLTAQPGRVQLAANFDILTPGYPGRKMQEMPGLIGVTCCQCNAAPNTHCYWSGWRLRQ